MISKYNNHHSAEIRRKIHYPFQRVGIDILNVVEVKECGHTTQMFTISPKDYKAYAFLFYYNNWAYFLRTKEDLPQRTTRGSIRLSYVKTHAFVKTKKIAEMNQTIAILIEEFKDLVHRSVRVRATRVIKVRPFDYAELATRVIGDTKNALLYESVYSLTWVYRCIANNLKSCHRRPASRVMNTEQFPLMMQTIRELVQQKVTAIIPAGEFYTLCCDVLQITAKG